MACCGGKSLTKQQTQKVEENRRNLIDILKVPRCGYCGGVLQRLPNGTLICSRCLKRKT